MTEPTNGVRDFTVDRTPIRLRLGGVLYEAQPVMGGAKLKKITALARSFDAEAPDAVGAVVEKLAEIFALTFPGLQGEEIAYRLSEDEDNPIDLREEAIPAFYYLLERWGLRPTGSSSNSPDGSATQTAPSEDTSSTGGPSPTESDPTTLTTPPTG